MEGNSRKQAFNDLPTYWKSALEHLNTHGRATVEAFARHVIRHSNENTSLTIARSIADKLQSAGYIELSEHGAYQCTPAGIELYANRNNKPKRLHVPKDGAVGEKRERILQAIRDKPGMSAEEIGELFGISSSGAEYHIVPLEKKGLVKHTPRTNGPQRYYSSEAFSELDPQLLQSVHDMVRDAVVSTPGLTQKEISTRLGLDKKTVSIHLSQLEEEGVVRHTPVTGKSSQKYYASNDFEKLEKSELQTTREKVYELVRTTPGADERHIATALGIDRKSAVYHLDRLEKDEKVTHTPKEGDTPKRYYVREHADTPELGTHTTTPPTAESVFRDVKAE